MNEQNLISIQKYAVKNKLSTFAVIKKINSGELQTIKKDDKEFIVDTSTQEKEIKKSSMRRAEFSVEDKEIFLEILNSCEYGTLCLFDKQFPYSVPLNFAYLEDKIIFHGANEGKKITLIEQNHNASFNIVKPYSFIPSYFSNTTSACPATQFFASILINGKVSILTQAHQKAKALEALMQKMQPQKGYESIDETNPIYTKMLTKTAVFALEIENFTIKIKAAQNLTKEAKENLFNKLEQRGEEIDLKTIELIKKYS